MDNFVYTTAISRVVLIGGVFFVNWFSLLRLLIWGRGDVHPRGKSHHCVHSVTASVIILSSIVYLSSWLPYLGYSLTNGQWPLLTARDHCVLQYSLTSQVTTILLAVLTIRKLFDAFSASRATILSYAGVVAWIIPQLLYLALTEVLSSESNSFQFLDRLLMVPSASFVSVHQNSSLVDPPKYSVGFMICVHQLAAPVVTQLFWHYVVLVLPLTVMIFVCFAVESCKSSMAEGPAKPSCRCEHDLLIALSLYFNFMWLLLLRPIIVLQSLYMNKNSVRGPPYLDFGAHLVLIFASIFVPFARHAGFRSACSRNSSKSNKNFKLPLTMAKS